MGTMDAFLRTHDVDVGRTFAILIYMGMVESLYEWFFELLFQRTFNLNVGILLLFVLAAGMWNHRETARRLTLGLLWLAGGLVCLVLIASPFWQMSAWTLNEIELQDQPFWRKLVALVAIAPLPWLGIAALRSQKAREEFSGT